MLSLKGWIYVWLPQIGVICSQMLEFHIVQQLALTIYQLSFSRIACIVGEGRKKIIRFEAMLIEIDDCEEVITSRWKLILGQTNLNSVQQNVLSLCGHHFMRWNKQSIGRVHTKIWEVRNKIKVQLKDHIFEIKGV